MAVGETDLDKLLASIEPVLKEGTYVFVTTTRKEEQTLNPNPICRFVEEEGITLIMLKEEAEALGFSYLFPSRMITLNIHSSLEAVGFLAAISKQLTEADISSNVVSAYYHDHLFIAEHQVEQALSVLEEKR